MTVLNLNNKNITSLEGLQYCTKLSTLNLEGNSLVDLSPISNLTSLIKII
ncbi:leucine-rich repeat domain-containing protein [uncultured Clostridium sp.]